MPNELDIFLIDYYKKFSYGHDLPNGQDSSSPYIIRDIGSTWGPVVPDYFIRGGFATANNRGLTDVIRHNKFMFDKNGKGVMFGEKQQGIQLTNPLVEKVDTTNLHTNEPKNLGDITRYETVAYGKLGKISNNSQIPQDFRELKEFNKRKDGNAVGVTINYKDYNIHNFYGVSDSGNPNVDRSDFTKPTGLNDKINMLDVNPNVNGTADSERMNKPYKDSKDFIKFVFFNMVDNGGFPIVFRAFITNMTDTSNPQWSSYQYNGRPDAVYTYGGTERTISINFQVAAFSRGEMKYIYRKLNYLKGLTWPSYKNGKMIGPWIRLTIGDYFQKSPCFINNLTFTPNMEAGWEINIENDKDMFQLPKFIEVSLSIQMIMDFKPSTLSRFFSVKKYKGYDGSFDNEGAPIDGDWLPESPLV